MNTHQLTLLLQLAGIMHLGLICAGTLAGGGNLARALCAFLAAFWTVRLIAAAFVFDVRPYLTNTLWRLGYFATNVVFAFLPVIYAFAALNGGAK